MLNVLTNHSKDCEGNQVIGQPQGRSGQSPERLSGSRGSVRLLLKVKYEEKLPSRAAGRAGGKASEHWQEGPCCRGQRASWKGESALIDSGGSVKQGSYGGRQESEHPGPPKA